MNVVGPGSMEIDLREYPGVAWEGAPYTLV